MSDAASTTGWFGKLPGAGDFAHRRLPSAVVQHWDEWQQHGMARLKQRDSGWLQHYLHAPVWHCAIGPGVLSELAWCGVMMASVDAVGRYFPLSVLAPALRVVNGDGSAAWRHAVAESMLLALAQDDDVARFDQRLSQALTLPDEALARGDNEPVPLNPRATAASLWWVDGQAFHHTPAHRSEGLPTPDRLASFFLWPASEASQA